MAESEYVRGLRAAAAIVIKESAKRREAGEKPAMYALNTAWHAIQREIDANAPQPEGAATTPHAERSEP